MCFGCSKEPFSRDGSFEYPQPIFWLRNMKNNFQLPTLVWGPVFVSPAKHGRHIGIMSLLSLISSTSSVSSGASSHSVTNQQLLKGCTNFIHSLQKGKAL